MYEKLVKNTKLLQKHISVELCSLGSKKSKQINEVVHCGLLIGTETLQGQVENFLKKT
jgi:hypothetical protein